MTDRNHRAPGSAAAVTSDAITAVAATPRAPFAVTVLMIAATALAALALAPAQLRAQGETVQLSKEQATLQRYADKLLKRARERARTRQLSKARDDFKDVIETLAEIYGPEDARLAPIYKELAATRFAELLMRNPTATRSGIKDMGRAVAIYEKTADTETLLAAYIEYGDFAIIGNNPKLAAEAYGNAWRLLSEADSSRIANDEFGQLRRLHFIVPEGVKARQDTTVRLTFTVGADGRPADIRTEGTASRSLQRRMAKALSFARFRPVMIDGEFVPRVAYIEMSLPGTGATPRILSEPARSPPS